MMQKIVVFIEEADEPSVTPLKIGNLFMNRFSIDDDASFEILKILYPKPSCKLNREFRSMDIIRRDWSGSKGQDLNNLYLIIKMLRKWIYFNDPSKKINSKIPLMLESKRCQKLQTMI